jgi:cell division protease FtsH
MEKSPKKPAPENETPEEGGSPKSRGFNPWVLAIAAGAMLLLFFATRSPFRSEISFQLFEKYRELNEIAEVTIVGGTYAEGRFRLDKDDLPPARLELVKKGDGYEWQPKKDKEGKVVRLNKDFYTKLPPDTKDLQAELKKQGDRGEIQYGYKAETDNALMLYYAIMFLVPIGLFAFMWIMLRRSRDQLMGGGFLSGFTKSPARKFSPDKKQTTFADVAGLDSVKADLQEIIEFLKEPAKFQRLGGQVPKGVLLLGPPGTGKTLLARAVAGEAGVPFFSANGSEFIQMFVGVGAGRVRDLFQTAKKAAPSIIFIDEIDAVGRQRGAGLGGGHDEREQTLNQILGEMDGFNQGETVIVIAATNRPDVLDPALLRPGRFDRHITVDRPTKKGREAIFKVHVREVPLADDVELGKLAAGTVGMTGADIKNIVNEAALWAARQNKTKVEMEDFDYARDKVLMGPRREDALIGEEKRRTAYHEAGHALIAWLLEGIDKLHKVTVIPRGRSLGVTETVPEEDKMNISEHELHNRLSFFLGGREAERLIYEQCSAGAENDLERATRLTRRMVTQWGMSRRLGPVSYKMSSEDPFLGREMHSQRQFSEHTLQIIDEEVARILHAASEQAHKILSDNRDKLDAMAEALIDREELGEAEITELIGPSIHRRREEAEKTADQFEEHTNGSPTGDKSKHSAAAGSGATPSTNENGQETA